MHRLHESLARSGGRIGSNGMGRIGRDRVGEPIVPGRTDWKPGAEFAVEDGWYRLTIFEPGAGAGSAAAHAVREEVAELAVHHERPLLVLAYRFGHSVGWADLPFSWPLAVGQGWARSPELTCLPGVLVWVSLVEARSGLIRAQRGLLLETRLAAALATVLRDQAEAPFDGFAYSAAVVRHYIDGESTETRVGRAIARMRVA